MKKVDVNALIEGCIDNSPDQFQVTPADMLEGTLLDEADGASLSLQDQLWAINAALSATQGELRKLTETYDYDKIHYPNYQDGEHLHDIFERIRYLGGIYAFQYIVINSSFLENFLSNTYTKITGNKYNTTLHDRSTSKISFIFSELVKTGISIDQSDIKFLSSFYKLRNEYSHNQVELPQNTVIKILNDYPSRYWEVYTRNGEPFFLCISQELENEFINARTRLFNGIGLYLLTKGKPPA